MATFQHPNYTFENDKITRKTDAPKPTFAEDGEVITELGRFVQEKIVADYGFVHIPVPEEDSEISTSIVASSDWQTNKKLFIIIQNASGSMLGIFSRSLCMDKGLTKGSMLGYIKKARDMG